MGSQGSPGRVQDAPILLHGPLGVPLMLHKDGSLAKFFLDDLDF